MNLNTIGKIQNETMHIGRVNSRPQVLNSSKIASRTTSAIEVERSISPSSRTKLAGSIIRSPLKNENINLNRFNIDSAVDRIMFGMN